MKQKKPMGPDGRPIKTELQEALWDLLPFFKKAAWLSVVINLLMLAPTVYMMEVYERVVNSRNTTTLLMLLALVIFIYLVMEALDLVRTKIMHASSLQLDQVMRSRAFDAMYEARRKMIPGGTPQVLNDLRVIRDFLASPTVNAFMDAPVSMLFLIIVFMIHPSMALFALFGAFLQVVLAIKTEKETGEPLMEANRAAIDAQNYAANSLKNSEVIEAMGMLGSIRSRWQKMQRRFLQLQATASDHAGASAATSKVILMAQGSLMLGLGVFLAVLAMNSPTPGAAGAAISPALMIVASVLGGRMMAPMVMLIGQWKMVVGARDSYQRLNLLLTAVPVKPPSMPLPAPSGALQLEHVYAEAPGSNIHILKGVNFALQPGECLAVLGPSASGKTTLARVLIGIWSTSSGKVRLDGADVFQWNKIELGPHLGYLPQTVELFEGTIAENIARFGNVDLERIYEAAKKVGLHEFVLSLELGYDTPVGEEGAFLSGGQRQRVGLARAVYGNPKLVVLDEPNSSLDETGDAALISAIQSLKASGATVVMITHRTNALAVADKMLILQDGQMQAFGPRDTVLQAIQEAAKKHAEQARALAAQNKAVPNLAGPAALGGAA